MNKGMEKFDGSLEWCEQMMYNEYKQKDKEKVQGLPGFSLWWPNQLQGVRI